MAHLILWNSNCNGTGNIIAANTDASRFLPVRSLGPHQLASWLGRHGYTVKVLDYCNLMTTPELIKVTNRFIDKETIGIGVSSTFWDQNPKSLKEPDWVVRARGLLADLHPKLNWIVGGSRISYNVMKFTLPWIEFPGYSENSVLKFLDEKSTGHKVRHAFDIKKNCVDYKDDMNIKSHEVLPIELSRGCQFKCRFCRYAELGKKKNTYIRDYDLIEYELRSNYEKFGVTRYAIMDDTVNESIEKLEALANIAQRLPFQLEWVGYTRLDLIGNKPYTADVLTDSGLRGTFFGIESFHPKASQIIGKGWNGKHGKDFLLKLKDKWNDKVQLELSFIAGLNGESEKDLDNTQQWCIDNKMHHWRWNALHISNDPNQLWKSEFDADCEKYGYRFPNSNNNQYWVTKDWNFHQAKIKADNLTLGKEKFIWTSAWHAAQIANLGYSFSEIFKLKESELNYSEFHDKTKIRVREYIHYQMSL